MQYVFGRSTKRTISSSPALSVTLLSTVLFFLFFYLASFPLVHDDYHLTGKAPRWMETPTNESTVNNWFYTNDLWDHESQSGKFSGVYPFEQEAAQILNESQQLTVQCDHTCQPSYVQLHVKDQLPTLSSRPIIKLIQEEAGTHSYWTGNPGQTARHR